MPTVEPAGTALFLKRWLRRPFATGAVVPSGRLLAEAMATTTRAVIDGRPLAEVAELTDASLSAVKTRVWRARKELDRLASKDPVLSAYVADLSSGREELS